MSIKGKSRGLIALYAFLLSATAATVAIGSSKYNPGGGGGGAVSTVSGSSGVLCSPTSGSVVCSASAVPLASLASQADQTFVCNRSGGSSAPSACTAAQATAVIAPATESLQGALSAADKIKVDALDNWWSTETAAVKALVPALTECKQYNLGTNPFGVNVTSTTTANGALVEGGGVQGGTASTPVNFGQPFTANVKTHAWSLSWRGRIPAPDVTHTIQIAGISNPAGSHFIYIGALNGSGANYILQLYDGTLAPTTSTKAADSLVHNFRLTYDGSTTVTAYVDGVSVASTTTLTHMMSEAGQPFLQNTVVGDVWALKALTCYVAP